MVIVREEYLKMIRPFYESDLIKVLISIRRCGKKVLLIQIETEVIEKDVEQSQIRYLNFEDLSYTLERNIMVQ